MAVVAELLRLRDGTTHVGEDDRPHPGGGVRGSDRKRGRRAEQRVQRRLRIELDDEIRRESVRFAMDRFDRVAARALREAEDRPVRGVEPVRVEPDVVLLLDRDVELVRVSELLRRDARRVMPSPAVQGVHRRLLESTGS